MKNKKKIIIILAALAAAAVLIIGGTLIKNNLSSSTKSSDDNTAISETQEEETAKEDEKKDEVSETKPEEPKVESNSTSGTSTVTHEADQSGNGEARLDQPAEDNSSTQSPVAVNNMYIQDEVNGGSLYSSHINFDGSKSLEQIMNEILPQTGKKYLVSNGYVSAMFGLKEKAAGPLSGWVFYVNGNKSPVGIASVRPKNGDVITWKYVKDGVNN